jgi:hypothetical protein
MSSTSQTVTVTDSAGNVYSDAVAQIQTSDGHQLHLFYAKNIAGGSNTVTATFSATNNHPWLAIYEYRGLSATSPLDRTSGYSGTVTVGSGFVLGEQSTSTSPGATETALVTATGSYAGTFALSSSTNWSALVATFK